MQTANLQHMFSINKDIYYFSVNGRNINIYELNLRSKIKRLVRKLFVLGHIGIYNPNYDNYSLHMAIFGFLSRGIINRYVVKYFTVDGFISHDNYCITSQGQDIHIVSTNSDISLFVGFDELNIWQSPDREKVLLRIMNGTIYYHSIIQTNVFLQLLFDTNNRNFLSRLLLSNYYFLNNQFKKYMIDIRCFGDLKWLTSDSLYSYRDNTMTIYNIYSNDNIKIKDIEINLHNIPYLIHGLFYFLLDTKILIANYDEAKEIVNQYKLVHYIREFDLFVNAEYDVYIQPKIGEFVRFRFVGDYYCDSALIPQNIEYIIECLLVCGIVYDIANEIYCKLLKLDNLVSIVY